ncbi:TadE/TadG family type IV pilus assembly protein [Desulfonatronum thiodismutans]|uniref:TadE/TadG family type IV pilus assembly protein n=1 Tax=Desulfonatronum thiodismutans TaxID=159290 RepID=UPI0004ABDC41|nr:TadE/TadG family type IV pilus assembly protein [Desulfonatronum thiodismutans]
MCSDPKILESRAGFDCGQGHRFRRGQSGQTTVFLALSMMVLICFLAFMVDVGQLVHDRILTQNVADMVALSAANVQAAGMNELADLNEEYRLLQRDLLKWLQIMPYADEAQVRNLVRYFKDWMTIVRELMRKANKFFPEYAEAAAYNTLDWYNDRYGDHFEIVMINHPRPLTELVHTPPVRLFSMYLDEPREPPPTSAWFSKKWRCEPAFKLQAMGVPFPYNDILDKPYMKKVDGSLTYMVVHVRRQARPVFVNLPAFGYDVEIPTINAFAGLIPTGGTIEDGKPEYFARFVPLERLGYGQFRH